MNRKTIIGIVVGAFMLFGANTLCVTPAQAQGARRLHPRRENRERHPEIRRAINALENAKTFLKNGAHDFSGHRVEAIKHVDEALRECREALKSDKD